MTLWKLAAGVLLPTLGACAQAKAPAEMPPPHATFTLASRHLHEARVVNVYLPPGYAPAGQGGAYPTLYLLDGGLKERFPHVAKALDQAIRAGTVRPMLLVGIANTQRRRDMTGPTRVASERAMAPSVGGSAAFRAFIADELIPAIASRYRVDPSRGILGESLAGLFVMETLFVQPGLFDTHLALSPRLGWNDASLVKGAKARLAAEPALRGRLFMTSAQEADIAPRVAALAALLATDAPKGLYWTARPRPDLRHDNLYLTLVPQLLVDYYPSVTAQDASATPAMPRLKPETE